MYFLLNIGRSSKTACWQGGSRWCCWNLHGQSLESKFIVVGNHNLNLCSAAELNGKFVKANESSNQETQATTSLENDRAISAFNVMMSASRRLPILPPPSVSVWNSKDRLYNAIRSFIETSSLFWHGSEVSNGTAARCLGTLRERCVVVYRWNA